MNMMKIEKKHTWDSEWEETLHTMKEMNATYKELSYFLDSEMQMRKPEQIKSKNPRVIVLGQNFPDEILRAMNTEPVYLLGGSLFSADRAEQMVPRDTDSAIKSILGILTDEELSGADKTVVLLPLVTDSMRKLCDMLRASVKIVPFEVPSDREDPLQQERWAEEVTRVTFELEKHLRRRLSGAALREACRKSAWTSEVWQEFRTCCAESPVAVSGSAVLWIANSYNWCSDKTEWTEHLCRLVDEMKKHAEHASEAVAHRHVMLIGSPIYAPNYKIPFLIEEMGLENHALIHPDLNRLEMSIPISGNRISLIRKLAESYLAQDMSPAFTENRHMEEMIRRQLEKGSVHGIVWHILKGQIEYDFELDRLEKIFDEFQVPVFRLETDYKYQDVEQLRIRLEAFAEMLRHRANMHQEGRNVKEAV